MTMNVATHQRAQQRDRQADWLVILVLTAALLLGWAVKTVVENRTILYQFNELSMRYPVDWVSADVQPPLILHVRDRWTSASRATLILQRRPLPPAGEKPVSTVQQVLALERGSQWTAYRVLNVEEDTPVAGHTGMHVTFAYVETNPNPFLETLPVVIYGEDFLFSVGDQVYIVTFTAAEAHYARARRALQIFLRSLQVGG